MEITEVRIKLMSDNAERLLAFCSMTIDGCFVVRDLKIIRGIKGPFVAMPSRKLTDHCHRCHGKNALRSNYCANAVSDCGTSGLPRDWMGGPSCTRTLLTPSTLSAGI